MEAKSQIRRWHKGGHRRMEERNKVLIAMPVHNDFLYFKMAIESIYNTTNYPFKLLIIESASTDGSAEYADLIEKIHGGDVEVIHTAKLGPLHAYNYAFQEAIKREMDLYITQTDVLHPNLFGRDWLKELVLISKMVDCGAVVAMNGGGTSGVGYLQGLYWIGGWSTLYKWEALQKIGLYDSDYELGDGVDIDHTFRLYKAGY